MAAICVRAGILEHSFESSISIETRTGMTNRVYLSLISRTDEQRLDRRLCQRRPTEAYPSRKNIPERNDFSERRGRSGGSSSSEVRGFREWNVTSEDPRSYVGGSIGERISFHGYPDLKYSPFHRECQ